MPKTEIMLWSRPGATTTTTTVKAITHKYPDCLGLGSRGQGRNIMTNQKNNTEGAAGQQSEEAEADEEAVPAFPRRHC